MSLKSYIKVDSSSNLIVDVLVIDSEDLASIVVDFPDHQFVVDPENNPYAGIGNEYVNGYFQPVEPESDSWTKNSDGVWNEIVNKPEGMDFYWHPTNDEWEDDPSIYPAQ